jgi:hypothetical protein
MPGFALSRRQRGFESRWGHKIKSLLTRPNAPQPYTRRQVQNELRERQGSGTARHSATTSSPTRPLRVHLVASLGSVRNLLCIGRANWTRSDLDVPVAPPIARGELGAYASGPLPANFPWTPPNAGAAGWP